jgi:3'-phosphoadenosine 5'-phosphosulfate sulfotransferase
LDELADKTPNDWAENTDDWKEGEVLGFDSWSGGIDCALDARVRDTRLDELADYIANDGCDDLEDRKEVREVLGVDSWSGGIDCALDARVRDTRLDELVDKITNDGRDDLEDRKEIREALGVDPGSDPALRAGLDGRLGQQPDELWKEGENERKEVLCVDGGRGGVDCALNARVRDTRLDELADNIANDRRDDLEDRKEIREVLGVDSWSNPALRTGLDGRLGQQPEKLRKEWEDEGKEILCVDRGRSGIYRALNARVRDT